MTARCFRAATKEDWVILAVSTFHDGYPAGSFGRDLHGSLRKWTGEDGPGAGWSFCTWKYNYREQEGKNEPLQGHTHTDTCTHK